VYERVPDYWGESLPVNVGKNNFDTIRIDYYRDSNVATEAFKAGEYDIRLENASKTWATQYDVPAVRDGTLVKTTFTHKLPAGMQGFVFNTRRELFRDRRVRAALTYGLDFEWSNKNLFYGQYMRTRSYFDNSELAATGVPSGRELAVLEPYRGRLPEEVFSSEYNPPSTDGSGRIRANLSAAVALLEAAGWQVDPSTKKLVRTVDGKTEPFVFEILLYDPQFERVALPFVKNLERLGIEATVRTVDTAQYRRRLDDFDFDMIVGAWGQSLSPGNEQRAFWGSKAAHSPGSHNWIGVADPVVDELIEKLVGSPDRASLVVNTRALDRVLQWGHWVIPHWHIDYDRVLYWNKFSMPAKVPDQGVQIDTWWVDAEKAAALPVGSKKTAK
jgi:microcin C transport system substrate-binding protein